MSRRSAQFVLAGVLFAVALLARIPLCTNDLFISDAADYVRASRSSLPTLYFDSDSLSASRFIARYRESASFRSHPWGLLYQQNDGAALRHFHVPVGFYLPALSEHAGWDRHAQRIIVALSSAATAALCFWIVSSAGVSITIAVAASLFLCFSPVMTLAGTALSPHALFSLAAIAAMYLFCQWLDTNRKSALAAFSLALGLAVGVLELSPLLVLSVMCTFAIWMVRTRSRLFSPVTQGSAVGMLAAALVAVIAWPGGLLRGGYLLSYGVFVFQGIFRSGVYFQQRNSISSIYRLGDGWLPGFGLVLLLAVAIYTAVRKSESIAPAGFTVFSTLLFMQGLANGFRNPTYASHAVFAISVAGALAWQELSQHGRRLGRPLGLAVLALFAVLDLSALAGWLRLSPATEFHDARRVAGAIAQLDRNFPAGTTFVVTDDSQAFITYAPKFHFYGSESVSSSAPETWVKPDRYYLLFDSEAATPPRSIAFCPSGSLNDYGFLVSCNLL